MNNPMTNQLSSTRADLRSPAPPCALLLLAGLILSPPSLFAQQDSAEVTVQYASVDGIAAVVGRTAISLSRVEEQLNILRTQIGGTLPTDSTELRELKLSIVDQLVENELLVQAALADTAVIVTDEQIQAGADERVRAARDEFSSQLDYERSLRDAGIGTPDEHRRFMHEQVRVQMLREALEQYLSQRQILRPIPPTEREMREYFEVNSKRPGWPGQRPPTVSFRQIVVKPEPDSAALRVAFSRADSALQRLRKGEDFAAVAAEYSMDPSTKDAGGELGWFRRSTMTPAFERAAFGLRPGELSEIVFTPFGFHVIQVQRVDAAEIRARHVLVIPEITEENRQAARTDAEIVIEALRNGAPFDSMVRMYHYKEEQTLVDRVARENLPPGYKEIFDQAQPGDIMGPLEITGSTGVKYIVIIFEAALGEGEFTFDELRDRIYSQLSKRNGMNRYINELKSATYIDIRI